MYSNLTGVRVSDHDLRVTDPQALDEIDLYGELVIAASSSEDPLSASTIDEILGVTDDVPEHRTLRLPD